MKNFLKFIQEMRDPREGVSQEREMIVKSWYHPDSDTEVVVDTKPTGSFRQELDSHTNHVVNNPQKYGFKNIKEIFKGAGHSEDQASKFDEHLSQHQSEEDNYVDWHDPLVHAMHQHGWVRIVKSTDWETDKPNIYAGSHDMELSHRAAIQLAKSDPVTRRITVGAYKPKSIDHPDHFSPPDRAKEHNIDLN